MKKILILGAGIYQVPLIKVAKKLGIYTIVASIRGNYPGFELADKVYYENTTDYRKILSIARREKIDGIVAAIMALDRCIRHVNTGSVYDERGIFFI